MTTFGKATGAKPTFGKKTTPSPAGRRPVPAPPKLSPQAMAFLEAERARPPAAEPTAKPAKPVAQKAAKPPAQPATATPWAPQPKSKASSSRAPAGAYGGKPVWGRRVLARLVDEFGVWFLIFLLFNEGLSTAVGTYVAADAGSAPEAAASLDLLGYALFFMVAQCAYNIAMESSSLQATLGKMMVGAVVTTRDGRKPSLGGVIMRNTLGRFVVNAVPFCAGYVMGLFNAERRCLHDMMSGTVVRRRVPAETAASYGEVFA